MPSIPNLNCPVAATIGMPIELAGTPSLLLDLDAFEVNLRTMADWSQRHGVALRPHAKAHKSVAVAQAQLAHGAIGICCQKLSEAYPFAAAGVKNILISNQFVGADKTAMAIELARHVTLSVCVDHPAQVAALGQAATEAGVRITVLPEVDVGQGRCGVDTPDGLLRLIDAIGQYPALIFGGIQAYNGGAQHIEDWNERKAAAARTADRTAAHVRALDLRGIACTTVTGAGTGSVEFDATAGIYTELQPGSYIFLDRHYGSLAWQGALRWQHSLFIAATIMSTAKQGRAVCDVGLKGVAVDSGLPVVHAPADLQYIAANDEHGILELTTPDTRDRLGDRILLIPGHCDPTVNLYDRYLGFRNGTVEAIWDIEARGLSL